MARMENVVEALRFDRTSKGHQEMSQGKKTLPAKLRTVLFLVDANKDAQDLQRQIMLIGAPEDSLAQLVSAGYIAPLGQFNAPMTEGAQSIEDQIARFRVAK